MIDQLSVLFELIELLWLIGLIWLTTFDRVRADDFHNLCLSASLTSCALPSALCTLLSLHLPNISNPLSYPNSLSASPMSLPIAIF